MYLDKMNFSKQYDVSYSVWGIIFNTFNNYYYFINFI